MACFDNALLAVGTYESYTGDTVQECIIVFDKSGSGGQIQPAEGSLLSRQDYTIPIIALVTTGNTAYILDKTANDSTVAHSINPSTSSTLNRVSVAGDSLPFSNILAASALYNGILTYSSNGTVVSFNVFDINSGKWNGNGLVSADVVRPNSSTPTAAIIGGVIGGLLVIAIAICFFIRRHRQSAQKSADDVDTAQLRSGPNKPTRTAGQGYVQYAKDSTSFPLANPDSVLAKSASSR
ncbi:hypothetical protein BGZ47_004562 [Haplosporangium gracile]|nr:hypothetical protein BGZ47_004562 [Haplosporangium gracile]